MVTVKPRRAVASLPLVAYTVEVVVERSYTARFEGDLRSALASHVASIEPDRGYTSLLLSLEGAEGVIAAMDQALDLVNTATPAKILVVRPRMSSHDNQ